MSYLRGRATELNCFNGAAWSACRACDVGGGNAFDDGHDLTLFVFMFLLGHRR